MGLEVASFISQLVAANPTGADDYATADDHLRMLKTVLQTQFPNLGAAAVTPTEAELNKLTGLGASQEDLDLLENLAAIVTPIQMTYLQSLSADVQAQINNKAFTSHTHGTSGILDNAITLAKLADVATATILGRSTAGSGDPEALSAAQVRAILNVADGATAGGPAEVLAAPLTETTTVMQDAFVGVPLEGGESYIVDLTLLLNSNDLAQAPFAAFRLDYSASFVSTRGLFIGPSSAGGLYSASIGADFTLTNIDCPITEGAYRYSLGVRPTASGTLQPQFAVGTGSGGLPEITLGDGSTFQVRKV